MVSEILINSKNILFNSLRLNYGVKKMEKIIKGVSHPIPTEYAKRIYENGKTVFVGKSHLGKVSKGDKFVIYESHGAKAYTGWADIIKVLKMKPVDILNDYRKSIDDNS